MGDTPLDRHVIDRHSGAVLNDVRHVAEIKGS